MVGHKAGFERVSGIGLIGDRDPTKTLRAAYAEFVSDASKKRLRSLLNIESDGAHSYLKMALVGRAFAAHPTIYEAIAKNPRTELERQWLRWLATSGEGLFEYYPEMQPAEVISVYRAATWLEPLRHTKAPH